MTPDKKKNFKRKKLNLAVKRKFQMWLLVRVSGVVIISSLVAVLVLYIYSRQEVSSSFYSAHIQIRRVSELLLPVIAAGAFVSLLSGIALALFLPQKIAGPVYRVQKGLEAITDGDLTENIVLRRNDTLADLADSVNDMTASLRKKIAELKEIHRQLDQVIAETEHNEAAAASARQRAVLDRLRTEKPKNQ